MAMDYKKAGVDIEAGYRSVELIKKHVASTMRSEVLGGIGGFSGAFSASGMKDMEDPVLLSGTDGVGTKIKIAFLLDRHDTIGIDCVAMCVNDVACAGGEPLFFLVNSYTTGFQASVLSNMLWRCVVSRFGGSVDSEELCLPVTAGGVLPCGASGRWQRD